MAKGLNDKGGGYTRSPGGKLTNAKNKQSGVYGGPAQKGTWVEDFVRTPVSKKGEK